jgi:quercetin dioxygenase-like cupin family protein
VANLESDDLVALKSSNNKEDTMTPPSNLQRRSFLQNAATLGLTQIVPAAAFANPASTPPQGRVVATTEGEHLIHFRDRGNIFIKLGVTTGSPNLAVGTQQVMRGTGIPTHRHFKMEETFYILEGSGTLSLNEVPHSFEKGATLFIPRDTWHSFSNPDNELLLLWVVTPAGLDGFFRDTCTAPGAPPKQLTREQIREIARRYDTEFR